MRFDQLILFRQDLPLKSVEREVKLVNVYIPLRKLTDPSQLFFFKAQSKITLCLRAEGSKRVRNVSMHASVRSDYEYDWRSAIVYTLKMTTTITQQDLYKKTNKPIPNAGSEKNKPRKISKKTTKE